MKNITAPRAVLGAFEIQDKVEITLYPIEGAIYCMLLSKLLKEGGTLIDDTLLVAATRGYKYMDSILGTYATNTRGSVYSQALWINSLTAELDKQSPKLYKRVWKRNDNHMYLITKGSPTNFCAYLIKRNLPNTVISVESCMGNFTTESATETVYKLRDALKSVKQLSPGMADQMAYNLIRYVDMQNSPAKKISAANLITDRLSPEIYAVVKKVLNMRGDITAAKFVDRISK